MNIVIISGASRGLGLITANYFAKREWKVVAIGLSERPDELADSVEYKQMDVTDAPKVREFWDSISSQYPDSLITLVNNAGGFVAGAVKSADIEDYHKQMNINYFTGVTMTHALVGSLPKARIINIVSTAALKPGKGISAYGASKAAAMYFYKSLQRELPKEDYKITNIYPDMMATGGDNIKGIDPTEVAKLIFWQASQESSYYETDVVINSV